MDHFAKLVTAVALCFSGAVHAGYAQLTPPPGWVAGTGAGATYQPAAASAWVNSKALADAAIASASGTSKVRVSLGIEKAAAQRAMAARVGTALLGGPGSLLVTGLTLASAALLPEMMDWATNAALRWNAEQHLYERAIADGCTGSCIEWYGRWTPATPERKSTDQASFCRQLAGDGAQNFVGTYEDGCVFDRAGPRPFATRTITVPVRWVPVPADTVVQELGQTAMPAKLPNVVWPNSWPVQDPVVNPDSTGKPQPLFIPTGNPVKNPKFDPSQPVSPTNQPYLQPGIRVTSAPAPGEPWRVDVQPVEKPVGSADPSENKDPDDPSTDKPQEEPSLCEKHPDILACQKLDQPEDKDLPKSERGISITPDGGWGADNAACPAPRHLTVQGRDIPIPFDLFCTYMQGLRPIIIAMAWLSAAFILLGARESS